MLKNGELKETNEEKYRHKMQSTTSSMVNKKRSCIRYASLFVAEMEYLI